MILHKGQRQKGLGNKQTNKYIYNTMCRNNPQILTCTLFVTFGFI